MLESIIEMRNIVKVFARTVANDHISISVRKGEVHALLGENGAGKTTLMNILYGLYQPDEGEIFVRGQKVTISEPKAAISQGIGMVHQHFMLIPPFTVTENIVLGQEPRKSLNRIDLGKAEEEVQRLSKTYGLKVDSKALVQDISVGMQQRVEILKALYRGAEVLILDEPTAVLTPQEVKELMDIMRMLTAQGKSIIFITHKLKEVIAACDRVTVIRRGKVVGTKDTAGVTPQELANMMVGREVILQVHKPQACLGQEVLRVEGLSAMDNRRLPALKGISLSVRAGEILGIAAVEGNGQTELLEVLTGLRRPTAGKVYLLGNDVTKLSPRRLREAGIANIPQDRQKYGLILNFSLAENFILGRHYKAPYARRALINYKKVNEESERLVKEFDVRTAGVSAAAKSLSGGNQQKAIIAREFDNNPCLLVAAQPTRGVDVGAIEFIHQRLVQQRGAGKAIILISLELDEILSLSDRIAVMYEGEIVEILPAAEATEEKLGLLMAGGKARTREAKG